MVAGMNDITKIIIILTVYYCSIFIQAISGIYLTILIFRPITHPHIELLIPVALLSLIISTIIKTKLTDRYNIFLSDQIIAKIKSHLTKPFTPNANKDTDDFDFKDEDFIDFDDDVIEAQSYGYFDLQNKENEKQLDDIKEHN